MKGLKSIGVFLAVFSAIIIAFFLYRKYLVAPDIEVLNLKLVSLTGDTTQLKNIGGKKPKVICYYAAWCGDCIRELNALKNMDTALLHRLDVFCVSDEGMDKIRSFQQKREMPFQFFQLPYPFGNIAIHSIPVTYIVNEKGKLLYNKVGACHWEDNAFREYVKGMIER